MRHSFVRPRSVRLRLRAAAAAILVVSAVATAGCGSDSTAAEDDSVDLHGLDTGSYATRPVAYTAADATVAARNAESLRLGNAMPLPMDIDPALTHNLQVLHPFPNMSDVLEDGINGRRSAFGWLDDTAFAANPPGFTAGFEAAARSNADHNLGYQLTDVVMTFDSDSDAAAAATTYAANGFQDLGSGKGEPAQSSSHPTAALIWLPDSQFLTAFYPSGQYLILTMADDYENHEETISDLPDLIAKSDKAIEVTVDRLRSFRPTPSDQLTALPLDPQGILRLALPRPDGDTTADAFDGTLDAHGALQTELDPTLSHASFDRDGVDAVSYGAGILYRTRDSAAAKDLVLASADRFFRRIDSPAGLPNARCVKYHGPDVRMFPFVCSVTYGRYVAEMWSRQQQDVFQRISAQYAMLANNK